MPVSNATTLTATFAASDEADQSQRGQPWLGQVVCQQGAELNALPGSSGTSCCIHCRFLSSDPYPPMFHVLPSACARTCATAATLTLSKRKGVLQVELPQEGQPGPRVSSPAQLLPMGQHQGLARLSARCLMAAVLSASATSAGASAAAERGEWQPRRHHRRLEPEELREYAQATLLHATQHKCTA